MWSSVLTNHPVIVVDQLEQTRWELLCACFPEIVGGSTISLSSLIFYYFTTEEAAPWTKLSGLLVNAIINTYAGAATTRYYLNLINDPNKTFAEKRNELLLALIPSVGAALGSGILAYAAANADPDASIGEALAAAIIYGAANFALAGLAIVTIKTKWQDMKTWWAERFGSPSDEDRLRKAILSDLKQYRRNLEHRDIASLYDPSTYTQSFHIQNFIQRAVANTKPALSINADNDEEAESLLHPHIVQIPENRADDNVALNNLFALANNSADSARLHLANRPSKCQKLFGYAQLGVGTFLAWVLIIGNWGYNCDIQLMIAYEISTFAINFLMMLWIQFFNNLLNILAGFMVSDRSFNMISNLFTYHRLSNDLTAGGLAGKLYTLFVTLLVCGLFQSGYTAGKLYENSCFDARVFDPENLGASLVPDLLHISTKDYIAGSTVFFNDIIALVACGAFKVFLLKLFGDKNHKLYCMAKDSYDLLIDAVATSPAETSARICHALTTDCPDYFSAPQEEEFMPSVPKSTGYLPVWCCIWQSKAQRPASISLSTASIAPCHRM